MCTVSRGIYVPGISILFATRAHLRAPDLNSKPAEWQTVVEETRDRGKREVCHACRLPSESARNMRRRRLNGYFKADQPPHGLDGRRSFRREAQGVGEYVKEEARRGPG